MTTTITITSQQMDQMGAYLPDDRREAVHNDLAPCSPEEYLTEYATRYGFRDLEEAAELGGLSSAVRRVLHDRLPAAWWHGYKDTKPELAVRKLVTSMGYRYRLQYKRAPGRPDLAFPGRHKAIMVHGCFWHRHAGCPLARMPKSRLDFWGAKLEANRVRDERNAAKLAEMGWGLLVVWECELKQPATLAERICAFLEG